MANFINIEEIKSGDKIKTAYKNESSDSDKIFFKEITVSEVNKIEKFVIGEDGSKIYGRYANNAYFDIIK